MAEGYFKKQKQKNDDLIFVAWHTAYFMRVTTMPEYDTLVKNDTPKKEFTPAQMVMVAKIQNAARGGEVIEVV